MPAINIYKHIQCITMNCLKVDGRVNTVCYTFVIVVRNYDVNVMQLVEKGLDFLKAKKFNILNSYKVFISLN